MATIYKVLGQAAPAATTATTLYTGPAGKSTIISSLIIANRSSALVFYRVAIRPAAATLANQHYIAYDVGVGANDSTTLTLGLTLEPTDVITVYAADANLTFSAFGSTIDI
jgi:hypothetical protein